MESELPAAAIAHIGAVRAGDVRRAAIGFYTALSLEDVLATDAPTSPKVETDARGDNLRCSHCGTRIPMKRISTSVGVGFRIAG